MHSKSDDDIPVAIQAGMKTLYIYINQNMKDGRQEISSNAHDIFRFRL